MAAANDDGPVAAPNPWPELAPTQDGNYVLRLFVTGNTARSLRAVENVRGLCERYLKGRYDLEIIDVYQQPELAAKEQLVAAPTLIKKLPLPLRRLVGDMSNTERVLAGLQLQQAW